MKNIACRLLVLLLIAALTLTGFALADGATATITLSDDGITITGKGAKAKGSTVTITAKGVYEISGTLTKGQIIIDAPDKADVELFLSGLNITASENAAIYCKNADNLVITLADGT